MKVKHCPRCGDDKPLRQFGKASNRPDGKACYCKTCNTEHVKSWYRNNKAKANARSGEWARKNSERRNTSARAWYKRGGAKLRAKLAAKRNALPLEKKRDTHLRLTFGITLIQWEQLFECQGRKCSICSRIEPNSKKGWHTDHDHRTGKVRGILCHGRNNMLGYAYESIEALRAGAEYLEKHAKD